MFDRKQSFVIRKQANLTMEELSREIEISSGMISDIENEKTTDPRISTLIKIADYFEISLDKLVDRNLVKIDK